MLSCKQSLLYACVYTYINTFKCSSLHGLIFMHINFYAGDRRPLMMCIHWIILIICQKKNCVCASPKTFLWWTTKESNQFKKNIVCIQSLRQWLNLYEYIPMRINLHMHASIHTIFKFAMPACLNRLLLELIAISCPSVVTSLRATAYLLAHYHIIFVIGQKNFCVFIFLLLMFLILIQA